MDVRLSDPDEFYGHMDRWLDQLIESREPETRDKAALMIELTSPSHPEVTYYAVAYDYEGVRGMAHQGAVPEDAVMAKAYHPRYFYD